METRERRDAAFGSPCALHRAEGPTEVGHGLGTQLLRRHKPWLDAAGSTLSGRAQHFPTQYHLLSLNSVLKWPLHGQGLCGTENRSSHEWKGPSPGKDFTRLTKVLQTP